MEARLYTRDLLDRCGMELESSQELTSEAGHGYQATEQKKYMNEIRLLALADC